MAEQTIACHHCKSEWTFEPPMGRRDECPKCHSDARVCLNCVFYDPGAYHECREEQAEWVKEKNRGNFCSYFTATTKAVGERGEAGAVMSKLDALFGKGESSTPKPAKPGTSIAEELARFMTGKKP
jgi:hypothetical protein